MATIQIKNLEEEVVRAWKIRAAKAGQSLQEYMRAYLSAEAAKPTLEELFDRIESRRGSTNLGDASATIDAIHAEREERAGHIDEAVLGIDATPNPSPTRSARRK